MKTYLLVPLAAALVLSSAACAGEAGQDAESTSESDLSSQVVANHCEIFVDKGVFTTGSDPSSAFFQGYVKTLNDRLDAPIREVGFEGEEEVCLSCNVSESGGPILRRPVAIVGKRFFGASDYFEVGFPVNITDASRNETLSVSGRFYVETNAGTRYFARADRAVKLDELATFSLGLGRPRHYSTVDVGALATIGGLPSSVPARPMLNPLGCF